MSIVAALTSCAGVSAETVSPLAETQLHADVTEVNVYGSAATQKIEHELEQLQASCKRLKGDEESTKQAKEVWQKADIAMLELNDPSELERFAFWAAYGARTNYQTDVGVDVIDYGFYAAIRRLNKLYSDRLDIIMELAMLVRADAHIAEEMDEIFEKYKGFKGQKPPGTYVLFEKVDGSLLDYNQDRSITTSIAASHFNITRRLWSAWKPHWSGRSDCKIVTKFKLTPEGQATNITFEFEPGKWDFLSFLDSKKSASRELISGLIRNAGPFKPSLNLKTTIVEVEFVN